MVSVPLAIQTLARETGSLHSAKRELSWLVQAILLRRQQGPGRTYFPRRDYKSDCLGAFYRENELGLIKKTISESEMILENDGFGLLTSNENVKLEKWIKQRAYESKPLQYLIRDQEFLGLTLRLRPPTLIPRMETELWCGELVELIKKCINKENEYQQLLNFNHNYNILDLCSGTGCVGLSMMFNLLSYFQDKEKQPRINPTCSFNDISNRAIILSMVNARRNSLLDKSSFNNIDLFNMERKRTGDFNRTFQLIVSNPPYIPFNEISGLDKSVKSWEDHKALIGSPSNKSDTDDGLLFYHRILDLIDFNPNPSKFLLEKSGSNVSDSNLLPRLVFEVGLNQAKSVKEMMHKKQFRKVEIWNDFAGIERCVIGYN